MALYKNVKIDAFGYALPPERVSSAALEERLSPVYERLKLPQGRLELMTGIRERRFWEPGASPSRAAILAGRDALAKAGVDKSDIGFLAMCSVCRDFLEPATATVVHHALDLPETALAFDLSNACLGVISGMILLSDLIALGRVKAGMLVAGENSRSLVESAIREMNGDTSLTRQSVKSHFASLTIGSGAVAVVLAADEVSTSPYRLTAAAYRSETRHNDLCQGGTNGGMTDSANTIMRTDSETLLHRGVETARRTWDDFKALTGWENDTADLFCAHQVGKAHRDLLFQTLGLDVARDFPIFPMFGNTGSVACPLAMAMALEADKLTPGGKLAALGVGSGLVCGMLGVERDF